MKETKHRSMAELRQVKDTVYFAPHSHQKQKTLNCVERVNDQLLEIHNDIFHNFQHPNRNKVLSQLENVLTTITKK